MKRISVASLLALSLVWTASAHSAEGMYVSGALGVASASDADAGEPYSHGVKGNMSFDSGFGFLAAVGYGMDNFRVEGEFGYQKNDLNNFNVLGHSTGLSGDLSVWSMLCNGYYDFPIGSDFAPFVTAGLGFAQVSMNDFNTPQSERPAWSSDDYVFAWQIGAGLSYAVNNQLTVEAKYRYFATTEASLDDGGSVEFASNNVYLGARYSF